MIFMTFDRLQKALLFSTMACLLISCDVFQGEQPVYSGPELLDEGIEIAENVDILYSDSAEIRVRIEGPKMLYYTDRQNPTQEFPEGVKVSFYGTGKRISSILTAKYAIRFDARGMVIVRDSVVWRSLEKDEQIETSELIWEEEKERIYSKKFTIITRGGEVIESQGFEAKQDFSNIRMNAIEGQTKINANL
ncbi:MAG: LPS export ABC transporter periplasmic protein LptC [Saprospiraceae bacterium]|nr:LPS export ABC transporter periplasmic protein LptC [Saprospiraceae bacterium]